MKKKRDLKEDISLSKLIFYNIIFFTPILISLFIANFIAPKIAGTLQVSPNIASNILMIFFTLIVFLIVIPYVRAKENTKGVRYALIGFLIIGIFMAVPPIIFGDFSKMLANFTYIASYILLTFIYCPEVLGIDANISMYFKHAKQLIVIAVYVSIVLFYVFGFSNLYYQIYKENNSAYNFSYEETPRFSTFAYFSMITFSTIGYGEITPASNGARLLSTMEAILGMIIKVIFIAILFMYISNLQSWIKKEEKIVKKEEEEVKQLKRKLSSRK